MKATTGKMMAKLESTCGSRIFFCVRPRSNEIWVATAERTGEKRWGRGGGVKRSQLQTLFGEEGGGSDR